MIITTVIILIITITTITIFIWILSLVIIPPLSVFIAPDHDSLYTYCHKLRMVCLDRFGVMGVKRHLSRSAQWAVGPHTPLSLIIMSVISHHSSKFIMHWKQHNKESLLCSKICCDGGVKMLFRSTLRSVWPREICDHYIHNHSQFQQICNIPKICCNIEGLLCYENCRDRAKTRDILYVSLQISVAMPWSLIITSTIIHDSNRFLTYWRQFATK